MKKQDESSLELLLDTMCNTFGGVMFIAISLVVIISMTSSLRENQRKDDTLESVEQLTATIEALKIKLSEATAKQSELLQESQTVGNDPRLKLLSELATLEAAVRTLELQTQLELQSLNTEKVRLTALQQKLQGAMSRGKSLDVEIESAEEYSQKLEEMIKTLENEAQQIGLKMVFTTLNERKEMPYFIALRGDHAWRIGPDDVNRLEEANDDVEGKIEPTAQDTKVTCVPRKGAGVPTLVSDTLSAQLRKILSAIPKNRVPCFMVPPSSAESFYVLRECLKQSQLFHGFMLQSDDDTYTYRISTKKTNYEY